MFDKKWFIGQPVIPGSGGVVAWLWIEFWADILLVFWLSLPPPYVEISLNDVRTYCKPYFV